jgi:hypothetical protein
MSTQPATAAMSVRLAGPADRDNVVGLLRLALGGWPIIEGVPHELDPAGFFGWKHERGAFGPTRLVVAERDGEIVGVRAFMPWRLARHGQIIAAYRSTDTATLPALQRSGVFGQIRTVSDDLLRDAQISFGTPNPQSFGATMKLGGREVAETIRPWVRVAPWRTPPGRARRDGGFEVDAPPAAEVLGSDAALAPLLTQAAPADDRLTTARDAAYLRWRYGAAPLRYHALAAETDAGHRGVAIFRLRKARGGLPQAVVEELIVAPGERHTAAALLRAVARATRAPLMCCRFPARSPARHAAVRLGFVPRRQGLPLVGKRLSASAPAIDGPERWALSLGDIEVL